MYTIDHVEAALKFIDWSGPDHPIQYHQGTWFILKDGKYQTVSEWNIINSIHLMDATLKPVTEEIVNSLRTMCKTDDSIVPPWLPMQFRDNKEQIFLRKYYTEDEKSKVKAVEIYEKYKVWCQENDCLKQSQQKFVKNVIMTFQNIDKKANDSGTFYIGIKKLD